MVSRDADSGDDLAPVRSTRWVSLPQLLPVLTMSPPDLTIPEAATITAGESFDPMVGVSATDNTDDDPTETVQVIGSIDDDTSAPTC